MNCLEFRRRLETDPDCTDADFVRHESECPRCADALARQAGFSAALEEAARVEAPENLSSRILLRQSFSPARRTLSRRGALALAASLVAAVGLGLSAAFYLGRKDALAEEIFSVIRDADHAMAPRTPLDGEPVARALAGAGLDLTAELDAVTYAGQSMLRGKLAGHIVIQGELAPCTIFLIPDIRVSARYSIRDGGLKGLVVPIDGGVMAIVGAPGEELGPVVEQVKSAIRWRRA